jgi:hypothetical protein
MLVRLVASPVVRVSSAPRDLVAGAALQGCFVAYAYSDYSRALYRLKCGDVK